MKITVNETKLETGLRPNSAGIPSTLLSRGLRLLGFQLLGFYCNGFKGFSVVGSGDSVWDPIISRIVREAEQGFTFS